jgi:predicted transcriptional regulator
MVNPYLDLLIKNEMIQVNEKQVKLYETTLKGKSLLERLQKVHGELSEL